MRANLLGMYRLDPNRPLPDRRDLPSVPLDSVEARTCCCSRPTARA